MSGKKNVCRNCAYFHPIETAQQGPGGIKPTAGGGGSPLPTLIKDGECHFYPPLPNGSNFAVFPKVELNDWCGNYLRSEQERDYP